MITEQMMYQEIKEWLYSKKDELLTNFINRMKLKYGSDWDDYYKNRKPDESTKKMFFQLMCPECFR